MNLAELTRREFLRRAGLLGVNGVAAPWAMNLATIGAAAAQSATPLPGDYKAIVCVFLYGGNDYANTVVPYDDASYAAYRSIRAAIATPRDDLAATALVPELALPDARQFALAPQLTRLKTLFDAGHLGVLLNIGHLTTGGQEGWRLIEEFPERLPIIAWKDHSLHPDRPRPVWSIELGTGDSPFGEYVRALRRLGPAAECLCHVINVEHEPAERRVAALARSLRYMQRLWGEAPLPISD